MNKTNPQVDGYIRKNKDWQEQLQAMRKILLDTPLTEEIKWRVPCYTFENHNVVIIGSFKDGCTMGFVKGVLLKDAKGILEKPGENTQSARMARFTTVDQITKLAPVLKAYILEAIELEKAGAKVAFKKTEEFECPEEFTAICNGNPKLKAAFDALTPGRQRGYLLHFAGAKQSKTRIARVEKHIQRILDGKGLND